MEDFDKFEEELLQKYVYGRLTKLVALFGFLIVLSQGSALGPLIYTIF